MTNINPLDVLLAKVGVSDEELVSSEPEPEPEISHEINEPEPEQEPEQDDDGGLPQIVKEVEVMSETPAVTPDEPDSEIEDVMQSLTQAPEPVETVSIASAAMLCEFSVSQWSETKKDKALAQHMADSKGVDVKYVNATKKLLGNCDELKAIGKFTSDIRNNVHYKMSLPFYDSGIRLVPTTMYFEYVDKMSAAETKFWELVEEFLRVYMQKRQSVRYEMGDLYDDRLYPPVDEIRRRFAFKYNFSPVPEAGDFRVDIAEEQKRQLTEQYSSFYQTQIDRAMGHIFNELGDSLKVLSTQLDFSNSDAKKKKIYDSRFDNVHRLIRMMESCNVNGDPNMEMVCKRLRQTFDDVNPESLRKNETLRAETKRGVDAVIANLPSLDIS